MIVVKYAVVVSVVVVDTYKYPTISCCCCFYCGDKAGYEAKAIKNKKIQKHIHRHAHFALTCT